ncbi:hypothetical protein TorRG33x02_332420 [Trema orientale]|uniref:Uncharacterized GPI-anchored protein At5g19230-like domain-containing protein n=1 Tax=Trema orientale TaxID=63057 RepID=A0A2P5B577_TREOI|nr:hypothetical protein TorRG33x02_332420 [Trema orientale]
MASFKLSCFFVLVHVSLLLPNMVLSNDDEDTLLQGINSYRQSLRLPQLAKNGKADCLADEIADEIEDQPCTTLTTGANIVPSTQTQLSDYPKLLKKCGIDVNTTTDGVILPVCVPKLVPTLVLTNYTHTSYARYLNNSKYTGAGVGSEDDWMVVVLSTSTTAGSFSRAVSLVSQMGFEKEDGLFQGINNYRKSLNVSELKKNEKADCLADEIADDLEDYPCSGAEEFAGDPAITVPRLVNFPKLAKKCDIDVNTTMDSIILPVCVPKLVTELVLNNFTKSPYTKFLNNSKFTGAGVGSEDDWIVVVLATDKPSGSVSGAAASLVAFGMVQSLVVSFLGVFLALLSF